MRHGMTEKLQIHSQSVISKDTNLRRSRSGNATTATKSKKKTTSSLLRTSSIFSQISPIWYPSRFDFATLEYLHLFLVQLLYLHDRNKKTRHRQTTHVDVIVTSHVQQASIDRKTLWLDVAGDL